MRTATRPCFACGSHRREVPRVRAPLRGNGRLRVAAGRDWSHRRAQQPQLPERYHILIECGTLSKLGPALGRHWASLGRPWASLGRHWAGAGPAWASLGRHWAEAGKACLCRMDEVMRQHPSRVSHSFHPCTAAVTGRRRRCKYAPSVHHRTQPVLMIEHVYACERLFSFAGHF